jgi:hypothetical protein
MSAGNGEPGPRRRRRKRRDEDEEFVSSAINTLNKKQENSLRLAAVETPIGPVATRDPCFQNAAHRELATDERARLEVPQMAGRPPKAMSLTRIRGDS